MNSPCRYFDPILFKRFFMISAVAICLGQILFPATKVMAQEETNGSFFSWHTFSREQKVDMITKVIGNFQTQKGITIRKEPGFYVEQIDAVCQDHPELGDDAIGSIFRMLAIAYRDFDNGEDPEALIRAEIGSNLFEMTYKKKEQIEAIYQEYLKKKEEQGGS